MTTIENPNGKNATREAVIRAASIGGVIIVLIIGMWGAVSVAKNTPKAFSSLAAVITSLTSVFVPAGEKVIVSAPSLTVNAGETFGISWEHVKKATDGSYTFRYDCADGVAFTSPAPTGEATMIYCNTPFNFINNNNSITLTASSTVNRFVDVTVYIDFTPNGAGKPTVTGSTALTISNVAVPSTPAVVTPKPVTPRPVVPHNTPGTETSTTYPVTGTGTAISNPNGSVDLVPTIIEEGVVDKTTGVFTASSTPNRRTDLYRVAVRFAVTNQGTKASGGWTFNAVLPTYPSHVFDSPSQAPLNPGDRIEYTLGFDSLQNVDQSTFVVNVDPTGSINESNKNNNIVSYTVTTVK